MKRNSWIALVLVAVIAGLIGYLLGVRPGSADAADEASTSNWLFSQTADAGNITPNGDDTWTLTLTDVDPTVIAFTDRPQREAQSGSLEKLVEAWPEMFRDSDPNGVVVAHNAEGQTNSAAVELTNPVLDGSTLTYTVRVLTNEGGQAEPGASYDFSQVSVFIDDVTVTSWQCVTTNGTLVDPPGEVNVPLAPPVWRSECQINGGFPIPVQG